MWSSAEAANVRLDNSGYAAFLGRGGQATRIASMEELAEVLRAHNVPPYHHVPTIDIMRRLDEANLLGAANTALRATSSCARGSTRWG